MCGLVVGDQVTQVEAIVVSGDNCLPHNVATVLLPPRCQESRGIPLREETGGTEGTKGLKNRKNRRRNKCNAKPASVLASSTTTWRDGGVLQKIPFCGAKRRSQHSCKAIVVKACFHTEQGTTIDCCRRDDGGIRGCKTSITDDPTLPSKQASPEIRPCRATLLHEYMFHCMDIHIYPTGLHDNHNNETFDEGFVPRKEPKLLPVGFSSVCPSVRPRFSRASARTSVRRNFS